ncbi:nuclear transport factor 2 family protein [Anaeromyxobacter oryzisoli]|uniref:nuclear transport factor 2 family protein n=1 Tax=Anaeromyxobacter oryzisoli TaxID=2925408 RepID=UPI001F5A35F2|nr:nuclear transport factor 2 family protein [Anaeromyxobacter sp. SG63]
MMTSKLLASSAVALSLLHAPAGLGQPRTDAQVAPAGDARRQIAALMNQVQQARLKGDARFFEQYVTDDYLGIHGDGATETKAQLVDNVRSGALKYEKYDMREMSIRTYGDAAVANTLVAVKAIEANGKHVAGDYRTTWVWVKRGDAWRSAAFQATRIVP